MKMKPKLALLFLATLFSTEAFAKLRILTFHCNQPDFVEMQCKTLNKFLLDEFELIVFNDAKTEEDERAIAEVCSRYNVQCVRFQPEWHLSDPLNAYLKKRLEEPETIGYWGWNALTPLEELQNHPSVRHCHVIQYALDHFGYDHDDIVALMDGDNFLIKPLSIRSLLGSNDIVGFNQRADSFAEQRRRQEIAVPKGMEMFWVVFTAFNPSKLPDKHEIRFHVDVISGHPQLPNNTISDTGAALFKYLWKHPDLRLQAFPWQSSYTYRSLGHQELKKMGVSEDVVQLIYDISPENVQFFLFEHFVHFSAGSFGQGNSKFLSKLARFRTFINTLVLTPNDPSAELKNRYELACDTPSDINEHVYTLRCLASECSSVAALGAKVMVSSWGLLQGLSCSSNMARSYLGIDDEFPPFDTFIEAQRLARGNGIAFDFWKCNELKIDIPPVDLLFIDSMHTYCHLTYQLETFSSQIGKYIVMHDTSWGDYDDPRYRGDFSEYPPGYDRKKRGLWLAIEDFLRRHNEWIIYARYRNNYGLTILKRRTL